MYTQLTLSELRKKKMPETTIISSFTIQYCVHIRNIIENISTIIETIKLSN